MAVGRDGTPGSAGLHLAAGVPLLHPDEQVFAAMLEGWRGAAAGPEPGAGHGRPAGGDGAGVCRARRRVSVAVGSADAG